jgi:hypothetical protein
MDWGTTADGDCRVWIDHSSDFSHMTLSLKSKSAMKFMMA